MSNIKLFLLGTPRLERKGTVVKIKGRKTLSLLIYIALSAKQIHTRAELGALFWPEAKSEKAARASLRRALYDLRQQLEEELFIADYHTIRLSVSSSLWVDVLEFQNLLQAGRGHHHQYTRTCLECLPLLRKGTSLWNGSFMAGFTIRASSDFDEWQRLQEENLRQDFVDALEKIALTYAENGNCKMAIAYTKKWLELDSFHEPAHRLLMKLLDQTGKRSLAIRQYQTCVSILHDELGIQPESATVSLYEQICAGGDSNPKASSPSIMPIKSQPAFFSL